MAKTPKIEPSSFLGQLLARLSDEPYELYWRELGKFIHNFAQTEGRLISLIKSEAKVSNEIGGVLFHATRIQDGKDTLNRLLDATNQGEKKARLERPLNQFSAIATIRNNILHWGARHDGSDELLVSNADKYPLNLKEFRISAQDLERMTSDLHKINVWFMLVQLPTDSDHSVWSTYLDEPWLYTPPQPPPPNQGTDRRSRGRKE